MASPFGADALPSTHTLTPCLSSSTVRRPVGRGKKRAGYVLVLFAFLFFGLLGLAALVIDLGFARLAQRQMQTAVDSAALEGLRGQDASAMAPLVSRQQASQIVASLFTDYADSGGTVHYGAGPVVNFSGGIGPTAFAAAQTMSPGSPPVYQPTASSGTAGLELNYPTNAQNGDMVAGTYNPGQPSAEADDYTRADFTPAPPGSSTSSALLVRMRRTNNINGLDQEPGISSGGLTLPILFGRGGMMARSGSPGQLSVASGITVRATAIAGPQPAKTVGPLYSNTGGTLTAVAQLAPFAITNALWTQISGGATATVNPLAAGSGAMILDSQFQTTLTAIGQPLVASTNDSTLSLGPQSAAVYLPIYADYASQPGTIIGFVYYNNWSYTSGSLTLGPAAVAVQIGGQNVSPTMALPLPAVLAPVDVSAMLQDHASLFNQYPLYAPALVNHYIGPNQPSP